MKTTQEIIKLIPSSWDELTLAKFQLLTECIIEEDGTMLAGMENTIQVISKLTDIPVEDLEEYSMNDLQTIAAKLDWMLVLPVAKKKSIIKWKELDEISYNDYISFLQIQDKPFENLHIIIKNFSHTELTKEEILNISTAEAFTGFFLCRKKLAKYLNRSIKSTLIKLIWQRIKMKLKVVLNKISWK
jgi:hypothetical protein